MHPNTQLLALSAAALISRSAATPISAPPTVNCEDVTTGLDQSCWSKLNMTAWMNNWGATSNIDAPVSIEDPTSESTTHPPTQAGPSDGQTSVTVGDFSNGNSFRRKRAPAPSAAVASTPSASVGAAASCNPAEPWSTCFLRLGLGVSGQDCALINAKACAAPKAGAPPHTAQIFYGVWNIYAINRYFTTWWHTLQTLSQSTAGQTALRASATTEGGQPIFTSASQSFSIDGPLMNLLLKQTGGHELPGNRNTDLLTLLQAKKSARTYDVNTDVQKLARLMQTRLQEVLGEVMNDLGTFVKFAENGAFSTRLQLNRTTLVTTLEG